MYRRINTLLFELVLLSLAPVSADEMRPLQTPIKSYSFGAGFSRDYFYFVAVNPLNYKYIGDKVGFGVNLSYSFNSEYGSYVDFASLDIPVTFKIGNLEPLRISAGIDFLSYVYVSNYYGIYELGPTLSMTIPIPHYNSFNEFGISFPVGIAGSNSAFTADMAFRDNLQIMFNDMVGINFNVLVVNNINSSFMNARSSVLVGPCIRW